MPPPAGPGPSSSTAAPLGSFGDTLDRTPGAGPSSDAAAPAPPLYAATHADASVLAVRAPALADFLLTAPAADQLAWLHTLHVAVDGVLQRVPATKVVMTGESMLFVSGTENGDPDHASTLVTLATELAAVVDATRLPDGRAPRLQMGLHTGEVAAGVVGTSSLRYGVFGPAVTIARGLEEASAPGVLLASAAAVRRLPRGGRDRGWIPGGAVALPGLADPIDTRLLGEAAAVVPLAELRAAAAAVAAAWDPAARAPARGAAAAPALAPALDRALAWRAAAADAPLFAAALAATLLYGGALAAAGRLAPPAAARGAAAAAAPPPAGAVPLQAAAGAALLWAGALAAARAPGYAGERRDAVAAGLRALAAVPRVWRAYVSVPGPGLARLASLARRGVAGRAAAAAAAAVGPGAAAGAAAAAAQLAVAFLVPLPARTAARAAPLAAALAAASLAARLQGGELAAALAVFAVGGVAAPIALQAALAARGRAAVMRTLA